MLPAVYDTSIYTLCYWECCILALVTNFTKNKKKSRVNRELGNLSHGRGSRHGSKSSLSWRAIISSAIYSLWYHRIYNVSESWTLAFVAYFKKKTKKSRFNWELGEFITWFSFKARELKLSSISSRAKNSSIIYDLWYQRIYTVLRS